MTVLLAVDLGLKAGLAIYGEDGRLRSYRSHNFGSPARLRRGAAAILAELGDVAWLALEGGGPIADIWERAAARLAPGRELPVLRIGAEVWRQQLLLAREQRSGGAAKHHADLLARRVIEWSGCARPTSLRHDAAEAIVIGLWAVLEVGWLPELPPELRR